MDKSKSLSVNNTTMKKVISLLLMLMCVSISYAQYRWDEWDTNDCINYLHKLDYGGIINYICNTKTFESIIIDSYWINDTLNIPQKISIKLEEKQESFTIVAIANNYVFSLNEQLTSVRLPETLEYIGDNAFDGCENLKVINSPSAVKHIGYRAFAGTAVKRIELHSGLKYLGGQAFANCAYLTNIKLPSSLKEIGSSIFSGCKSLKKIVLPNGLTTIPARMFSECDSLEHIIIPQTVLSIEGYAFNNCKKLRTVKIPSSVIKMNDSAFSGCDNIEEVAIDGLEEVDLYTFKNAQTIAIGNKVKTIKVYCNYPMNNLTTLTLGYNIKSVQNYICADLHKIECKAIEPPVCKDDYTFSDKTYDIANLVVPSTSLEKYKNAKGWKRFFERKGYLMFDGHKGFLPDFNSSVEGVTVEGVTADGETQLKVYVDFIDEDFKPVFCEKKLFIEGQDVTNRTELTGHFGMFEQLDNGKWGFIYTAPKDFPEAAKGYSSYNVTIELKVTDVTGKDAYFMRDLRIARPGVLLLHGLFSDSSCFKEFYDYLRSSGSYASWQVYNTNYKNSNTKSFYMNTYIYNVVQKSLETLYNQLLHVGGVVSSKYDLVGHSMGGILSRKYAQEVNPNSVNRIITVNTPHSGSQGANLFLKVCAPIENAVASSGGASSGNVLTFVLERALQAFRKTYTSEFGEFGELGALADLEVNSNAIHILNSNVSKAQGIPVHAICSYMTDYDNVLVYNGGIYEIQPVFVAGPADLVTIFPIYENGEISLEDDEDDVSFSFYPVYNLYDKLFNDKNDGIVSYASQTGGLDSRYRTTETDAFRGWVGEDSWAHHTKIAHWPTTWFDLLVLLETPKSNKEVFASSFKPVNLSKKNMLHLGSKRIIETMQFTEPSDTTFIQLHAMIDSITGMLNIQLNKSKDVIHTSIFTYPDDDHIISAQETDVCNFRIPDSYEGNLVIYALGRSSDNTIIGDTTIVHIERNATLRYLLFDYENQILMNVRNTYNPLVIGGWSGGTTEYISAKFTTDNPDILNIDGQNIIAINEGECMLYASYLGLTDSIWVKVLPQQIIDDDPNSIQTIKKEQDVILSVVGNELRIVFDNNCTEAVKVDVYDATGLHYIHYEYNNTTLTKKNANINISAIPSSVCIVTVRTNKETKHYKFVK